MIGVKVAGVVFDNRFNSPVVLLHEKEGERVLPIFIGPTEATAIAMILEEQKFVRPLTLDLTKLMLDALGARVSRVIVTELKDDTFLASLIVEYGDKLLSFDARPSDSIGLALRYDAPVFVAEKVMDAAGQIPAEDEESRLRETQQRLRNQSPEEMGDFSL